MKELIEMIAKALVDNPNDVVVSEIEGEHTIVLELKVAKNDVGKIVGKEGNHAKAIRTILSAASGKKGKKYTLEIIG
ncbi:MAG: KH domain-containing protein [Deltaproteobacteria bacterium]|nr:KH domain-containing protein [Deltaproteobacteria bacterium]MCL5792102.1 KH domain-containing protein [Deltaproteobacteria bacterium]